MIYKIYNFILLAFISSNFIGFIQADECIPGGDDNTLCLSIENIDNENGLLDIIYSSDSDIQNAIFVLSGIEVINVSSDLSINNSVGSNINLFDSTNPLPSGENQLLAQIPYC